MHELDIFAFELPAVEEFISGDSRELAFTVVDGSGNPVDLTYADITWALYERAYQDDPADAVVTGDDPSVEIVTDDRVDFDAGEFEVILSPEATAGLWGDYYHRPQFEQPNGITATWRGEIVVTG